MKKKDLPLFVVKSIQLIVFVLLTKHSNIAWEPLSKLIISLSIISFLIEFSKIFKMLDLIELD